MAIFTRLSLLRAVSGRSVAREIRARATEMEMKKGVEGSTRSERLLVEEKSAFGKFEVCEGIACFVVVVGNLPLLPPRYYRAAVLVKQI